MSELIPNMEYHTLQQPWKACSRSTRTPFMDPNGPHWGWSWLEQWLAARPWEIATIPDNEFGGDDNFPLANSPKIITKPSARLHNLEKPSPTPLPPKHLRSSTAGRMSKTASSTAGTRKLRSPSPKMSPNASMVGRDDDDYDARSMISVQSEQSRRSSGSGSLIRDDESLASSQKVPCYMAPTQSAKAKTRLGSESKVKSRSVTPDRVSVGSTKKRLSCPPSPARSRCSTSSMADANSVT